MANDDDLNDDMKVAMALKENEQAAGPQAIFRWAPGPLQGLLAAEGFLPSDPSATVPLCSPRWRALCKRLARGKANGNALVSQASQLTSPGADDAARLALFDGAVRAYLQALQGTLGWREDVSGGTRIFVDLSYECLLPGNPHPSTDVVDAISDDEGSALAAAVDVVACLNNIATVSCNLAPLLLRCAVSEHDAATRAAECERLALVAASLAVQTSFAVAVATRCDTAGPAADSCGCCARPMWVKTAVSLAATKADALATTCPLAQQALLRAQAVVEKMPTTRHADLLLPAAAVALAAGMGPPRALSASEKNLGLALSVMQAALCSQVVLQIPAASKALVRRAGLLTASLGMARVTDAAAVVRSVVVDCSCCSDELRVSSRTLMTRALHFAHGVDEREKQVARSMIAGA